MIVICCTDLHLQEPVHPSAVVETVSADDPVNMEIDEIDLTLWDIEKSAMEVDGNDIEIKIELLDELLSHNMQNPQS